MQVDLKGWIDTAELVDRSVATEDVDMSAQIWKGCESCAQPLTQHPTEPKGHYDKVLVICDWNYIYCMY